MKPRTLRVVAFDGGLADLGWVVASLTDTGVITVRGAGVVHTDPTTTAKSPGASAALGTSVSADTMRRASIIARTVDDALVRFDSAAPLPFAVAAEAFSAPKGNVNAGVKVGFGLGAAISAAAIYAGDTVPFVIGTASPVEIKRLLGVGAGLTETASKQAVAAAVRARFPGIDTMLDRAVGAPVRPSRREHAYDAAAVLLTCVDRDRFAPVFALSV